MEMNIMVRDLFGEREKEFDPSRGDYIGSDGLWYCGKCHTPMQKRVEHFGEVRKEYIPCKCRRDDIECKTSMFTHFRFL